MFKTSAILFVLSVCVSVLYRLVGGGSFTGEFWQPTVGIAVISAVLTALLFRFVRKYG